MGSFSFPCTWPCGPQGANILVDKAGTVKLADFGTSKKIEDLATIGGGDKSIHGTPYWMAPEVIKQVRAWPPLLSRAHARGWSAAVAAVQFALRNEGLPHAPPACVRDRVACEATAGFALAAWCGCSA